MSVGERQKLPDGWRWVSIKDIGPITDGDWILNADYSTGGVRLLQVGDVGVGRFIGKSSRFISRERAEQLSCTLLHAGDVLISRMPLPIGRACILPDLGYDCITAVDVSIWRPKESIADKNYLVHYLSSSEWFLRAESLASGATRARISRTNLEQEPIPLPPLPEQKRIAAILTEKMAVVEKARAAAEARLKAARELPAAYLREVFEGEETQQWSRKRLDAVLSLRNEIVHPYDRLKGKTTFVGLEHLQSGTGVRTGAVDVDMESLTGRKPRFYEGDIVYGYLRPYLNKVWIAEFDGLCSVDQYVYAVNQQQADTRYIAWYMRSPLYLKRAPIDSTPGQLPRIRKEEVGAVEIELPPLHFQRQVVQRLEAKIAVGRGMTALIQEELNSLTTIPAALLRQAFSGGL